MNGMNQESVERIFRCTVVFDIDDTICWYDHRQLEEVKKAHPECHIQQIEIARIIETYVFVPQFDLLLKYLIDNDCRILFFSAGGDVRNRLLLDDYLSSDLVFGTKNVVKLKESGQFAVYSRHHMDNDKKDLRKVLSEKDSLENTILVDDLVSNAVEESDQRAMIQVPAGTWIKNHSYYLLGYFQSYFQAEETTGVTLRQFVSDLGMIKQYQIPKCIFNLTIQRGLSIALSSRSFAHYYSECVESAIDNVTEEICLSDVLSAISSRTAHPITRQADLSDPIFHSVLQSLFLKAKTFGVSASGTTSTETNDFD